MSWQKLQPDSLAWRESDNRQEKLITEEPSSLKQVMFSHDAIFNNASAAHGVLLLVVSGGLQLDDGQEVQKEDLLWIPGRTVKGTVTGRCLAKTCVFELQVSSPFGPAEITLIKKQEIFWQSFDDPAGRPTQPVQVLMEGNLSILRTRFVPEYTAGDHWHDFDTWYFITDGDIAGALSVIGENPKNDIYYSTGGGPEGVIAAAALSCYGGQIQGRLILDEDEKIRAKKLGIKDFKKKYNIDEIVKGDVIFCASGVTNGDLTAGVEDLGNEFKVTTFALHKSKETIKTISNIYNK